MNLRSSFFIFLVFLVACSFSSQEVQEHCDVMKTCPDGSAAVAIPGTYCEFEPCKTNSSVCTTDSDCTCGGIDTKTGDCFIGNKEYSARNVNQSQQCPDFCSGIAGHLETKCVEKKCTQVTKPREQVGCQEDAKLCPDGTAVGRVAPDCEFAPCPTTYDIGSISHWLCEDGSWKQNPEQCFENSCVDVTDCQVIGIKGICGPDKIAAPKSVHKAPVFYPYRCGSVNCSEVLAKCPAFDTMRPLILNVDCQQSKCVTVLPDAE